MILAGTLFNVLTVLVGSLVGLTVRWILSHRPKKKEAEDVTPVGARISDAVMKAVGLCTVMIGVSGLFSYHLGAEGIENRINALIVILSMAIGTVIGELINIQKWLDRFGAWVQGKFKRADGSTSVAEGFVAASLLFCVGAMTVVGSLESGLSGNHQTLYTKSILDLISSTIFSMSMGVGVLFSALFVLVYQGSITLAASALAPILTEATVAHMTCVGSLLILGLGLNLLGITKLKVANLLPSIFLPMLFCLFM